MLLKNLAIAATLTVSFATSAQAVLFADPGEFATFTYGGPFMSSSAPTVVGGMIDTNGASAAVAGNEEFEAVNGFTPTALSGDLVIDTGFGNMGLFREIDYDRTGISDPAAPAGMEMGTLRFTYMETVFANVQTFGTLQIITIAGTLIMEDLNGFYDTTPGTWVFSATIGAAATAGTYSTTISVPPDPSVVSEPAILATFGAGMVVLGIAARRRSR